MQSSDFTSGAFMIKMQLKLVETSVVYIYNV